MTAAAVICIVSDRRRLLAAGGSDPRALDRLTAFCEAATRSGADILQLREPDLPARALSTIAGRCVDAAGATGCRVVVNDRVDVAIAAGAHGVHLRTDSVDAASVRRIAPRPFLIGRSVHSPEEARDVSAGGDVDYLIFGTVFESASKPGSLPPGGLDGLAAAVRASAVPVLAIGGMTAGRAAAARAAGARGVAAVGAFLPSPGVADAEHLRRAVAALRRSFDTSEFSP